MPFFPKSINKIGLTYSAEPKKTNILYFFTVVVVYINKVKTTLDFNFDLPSFNKQQDTHKYIYIWKQRDALNK